MLARRDAVPPTFAQRENAKKTVEHFFRDGASTATAADACLRVHASDARAPFKTVHSPPLGGRGLGVGLWGGAFFLAKPQRTQRNKHGLAHTTKQSVLVCERPWQKNWFNGYFPWIGYVVSFRIVLTSPMNKW